MRDWIADFWDPRWLLCYADDDGGGDDSGGDDSGGDDATGGNQSSSKDDSGTSDSGKTSDSGGGGNDPTGGSQGTSADDSGGGGPTSDPTGGSQSPGGGSGSDTGPTSSDKSSGTASDPTGGDQSPGVSSDAGAALDTAAQSPAGAATAAGLPGGVSSAKDILEGNTPVSAALDQAQSPSDAIITQAQQGGLGTTPGTQIAANAFGPGEKIMSDTTSNLPGAQASPAPGSAQSRINDMANVPGAFTGDTQGLDGTMPSAQPVAGLGSPFGAGPSAAPAPSDASGFSWLNNENLNPGLDKNNPAGGAAVATNAAAPSAGVTDVTPSDSLNQLLTEAGTPTITPDQFGFSGGPQPSQVVLGPGGVPSTPVQTESFTAPTSDQVASVPLPTSRPDTSTVQSAPTAPAVDTSPISAPGGAPAAPGTTTSSDAAAALAGASSSPSPSGAGDTSGGGGGGSLAQQITAPIPKGPPGPPPPMSDDGSPAGNYNPEEGIYANAGLPGGPVLPSLPGGVQGPVQQMAPPTADSADGGPAGNYNPEQGIYDILNNAT